MRDDWYDKFFNPSFEDLINSAPTQGFNQALKNATNSTSSNKKVIKKPIKNKLPPAPQAVRKIINPMKSKVAKSPDLARMMEAKALDTKIRLSKGDAPIEDYKKFHELSVELENDLKD